MCNKCEERSLSESLQVSKGGRGSQTPDTAGGVAAFLGCIGKKDVNPWVAQLRLNGHSMKFQIDTGAEVSVVPDSKLTLIPEVSLQHSDRTLRGPSQKVLPVKGCFRATIEFICRETGQDIYLVSGLNQP